MRFGPAQRLALLFVMFGTLWLFARVYSSYTSAVVVRAQATDENMRQVSAALIGLANTIGTAQRFRAASETPLERLQHLYPVEEDYRQAAQRVITAINRAQSSGALEFVFQPTDTAVVRLFQLRDWLLAEIKEKQPLLSPYRPVDDILAALASHVSMYQVCFFRPPVVLPNSDPPTVRLAINACVEAKTYQLDPLP